MKTSKIPSIENWSLETCRRLAWQLRVLAEYDPALYEYTERWRDYYISQARGAKDLERPMYNSALRRETVADEKPDPQTNEILEELTNLWIEQPNAEIEKSLT